MQQPEFAMQLPLPGDGPGQNFMPVPQLQVLLVQVAVPPQSPTTSQQPALPFDWKPQAPAIEQVRSWQVLPAGQSVGRQQPVDGTQRPSPAAAPEQYLCSDEQLQTLLLQVAVPPQSAVMLQQGAPIGALPANVQVPFWQLAFC